MLQPSGTSAGVPETQEPGGCRKQSKSGVRENGGGGGGGRRAACRGTKFVSRIVLAANRDATRICSSFAPACRILRLWVRELSLVDRNNSKRKTKHCTRAVGAEKRGWPPSLVHLRWAVWLCDALLQSRHRGTSWGDDPLDIVRWCSYFL